MNENELIIFEFKRFINEIELNLECYEIIRKYFKEEMSNEYFKILHLIENDIDYMILVAKNHIFTAMLTLYSLLFPKEKNKDELSYKFKRLLNKKEQKIFNKIKNEFIEKKLIKIRHKLIAHKVNSDELYILKCFKTLETFYNDLKSIFIKLDDFINTNFADNNFELFKESYKENISNIINLLKEEQTNRRRKLVKNFLK